MLDEVIIKDDSVCIGCMIIDGKVYVNIQDIISIINECQPEVSVQGILDFLEFGMNGLTAQRFHRIMMPIPSPQEDK